MIRSSVGICGKNFANIFTQHSYTRIQPKNNVGLVSLYYRVAIHVEQEKVYVNVKRTGGGFRLLI